jgi:hypothetical protein
VTGLAGFAIAMTPAATTPTAVALAIENSGRPQLQTLILRAVPSGFIQQPDAVGDTGPSNLAKAARDDGTKGARSALLKAGFTHGYQRLWVERGAQDQNIIFVYAFRRPAGAVAYRDRTITLLPGHVQQPLVSFSVLGIPGAVGYQGHSGQTTGAIVLFVKGNYLVQAVVNSPSGQPDQSGAAQALANAQYTRI